MELSLPRSHARSALHSVRAELRRLAPGFRGLALLVLACAAALFAGALVREQSQRVAVAPGDERALVGFYERERSPTADFRWSRPGSALFLYGFDGRPAIVALRLNAARPGDADAHVELRSGERAPARFAVRSAWRRHLVLMPTNPTADTPVWFGGEAWRPEGDERDLLAAVAEAAARPAGNPPLPSPVRWLFLLSFPLLGWLLIRRRWGDCGALTAGLALVPLVAWAVARPAAAGYWLPTFGWPWWPLVPLAMLLIPSRSAQAAAFRAAEPATPWFTAPREAALLAAVSVLAAAVRLYALDTLPLGLWRDEARHGLLALQIWQDPGFRPVYVVGGADLPALLFYLMAPVVGTLGPGVASVRLVSAVVGALAPLALWWAARPLVGARAAVFGAALLAWSSWALSMSRWGFPATLDQLLTLGALGCALRLVHGVSRTEGHAPVATPQQSSPSRRWSSLAGWSLAGALGALSAYAYHTGRLAPLVLAALVALRLGGDRVAWRRAAPGLVVAALTGLLVLVPLLRFVAGDFAGYNRRTAAVAFYTNEDAGVHAPLLLLLRNAERYLLMWHVAGDANGRHHAPGAPMVDVVTGTLLLVGLALAARGDSRARLVLVWVGLGLVPGLLSTGAPHAMRGLPALAPACALAGLGLAWLTRDREPDPRSTASRRRRLLLALLSLVLAASLALNLNLYFHQMTRDPQVEGAFDVPETAMGRLVHAHTAAPELQHVRVFLPAGVRESEVVRFLGAGAQPGYFDVDEGLSAPPGAQALLLLPAEASVDVRAAAVAALGPGARELDAPRSADGRPLLVVYGVGQGAEEFLRVAFDRR